MDRRVLSGNTTRRASSVPASNPRGQATKHSTKAARQEAVRRKPVLHCPPRHPRRASVQVDSAVKRLPSRVTTTVAFTNSRRPPNTFDMGLSPLDEDSIEDGSWAEAPEHRIAEGAPASAGRRRYRMRRPVREVWPAAAQHACRQALHARRANAVPVMAILHGR